MEQNMDKEQSGSCKMCGCGHYRGHFAMRWLVGLLVLLLVFWLGMKLGELRGSFGRGYGRGGAHMRYQRPMMQGFAPGMMYQGRPTMMTPPTATTTPAKK